jgi:hypothetical protein
LYWPLLAVLRTKQQLKPRQQRTAKEMHSWSCWTSWIGASFLGESLTRWRICNFRLIAVLFFVS